MKATLIFCIALLLTACSGWHLRGSDSTTLQTNSVFLQGQSGAAYQLIEKRLINKGALTSLGNANLVLILEQENIKRRTAAVDGNAQATEYELTLTIDYQVRDAAKKVLRPRSNIRVVRSYNFDQNDVAGKDKEEMIIRKDMQNAAARQILQQLQLLQRQ